MSNHPIYDAALDTARLLGGNFKTMRDRKRSLARDLVRASQVEGFALADAITDVKKAMKWTRLASDEQNQMNVLFAAVRVIDGAWKSLADDVRKAFLDGSKIFSTLAKEIKDAEKRALEEAAKEEEKAAEQALEQATEQVPASEDAPKTDEQAAAMRSVIGFIDETPLASMTPAQLSALNDLFDAIEQRRAEVEQLARTGTEG